MTEKRSAIQQDRIVWQENSELFSATRVERAFINGYELVAFDIPRGTIARERVIGWEVWPPKSQGLGSPEEYARRLYKLMDDKDAFDAVIRTLEDDPTINREEMRQIASVILGYDVPKRRGRLDNLTDIRQRQSSDVRRWPERMKRPIDTDERGLMKGSATSFDEAKIRQKKHCGNTSRIADARATGRSDPEGDNDDSNR